MKQLIQSLTILLACAVVTPPGSAAAQATGTILAIPNIPAVITTPDRVNSRIGPLDFKDGAPSQATLEKVYDNLDFTHARRAAC